MTLAAGSTLGPYEILALLGSGGMGEVYRARDPRLGRDIALKTLPADFATDPERLARFEREARTVAGLSHPNIVVLHSIEEADGIRFLTMELVEGQSLDHVIVPGGLPLPRVLSLAVALSDAITAAHERGVVHRDLKPANVMLAKDGRLKVLDFGLARASVPAGAPELSRAQTMDKPVSSVGQIVGTVPYMAPEQIRGEPADARTDLFALGVLVYELATGRRPFGGGTRADLSSAILRDTPTSLSNLRAELPADLDRIVSRCLEKDPRDRFQTALDVHNEFRRLKRSIESTGVKPPKPVKADTPSIAILSFTNLSRDEDNEYFSDGLAEELLNVLTKIRGLRVAARSSAFAFKGRNAPVAEIGQALGVATVLEGSVRKAGDRLRISVQLIKVADGFHLWSERYDRTLDDIFAVQDDIAQAVVKELRTTLLGEAPDSNASGEARAEIAAAARGRGESGEAHRLYLEGRYHANRFSAEGNTRAIELLKQAVELEPGYALAWAGLSWAHTVAALKGLSNVLESNSAALDAAQRALALEPELAEAHLAIGIVQVWSMWDWKRAEVSLRKAVELAPGNSEAVRGLAMLYFVLNRLDEALSLARRAGDLDPLSVTNFGILGRIHRVAGRYVEAEEALRKAIAIEPNVVSEHLILAWTLESCGRMDEAMAEIAREPADWARLTGLAYLHARAGRREEADAALRELIAKNSSHSAFQIAEVYASRGDFDAAFEWLDRGYVQRDTGVTLVKIDPLLRVLHGDPRWEAFLRKMNLADI
jgi:serine/threonine protein kinase/Flp pilus assembly protein TadD